MQGLERALSWLNMALNDDHKGASQGRDANQGFQTLAPCKSACKRTFCRVKSTDVPAEAFQVPHLCQVDA